MKHFVFRVVVSMLACKLREYSERRKRNSIHTNNRLKQLVISIVVCMYNQICFSSNRTMRVAIFKCVHITDSSCLLSGVMSRRGRRQARELTSGLRSEARRHQRDKPDSPLLQNDNRQRPTTSYASVNSIDVTDHHAVLF